MAKPLEEAADEVVRAVINPGRNTAYHFKQVHRLKEEWPTLYRALFRLLELREAQKHRKEKTEVPVAGASEG